MTVLSEEPLQIGDKCMVQWRDEEGKFLEAVVIERRPIGHRKRKRNDPIPDLSTLKADEIEYYIHYVDHDRRLDEWINLEKFQLSTLQRHEEATAGSGEAAATASVTSSTALLLDNNDNSERSLSRRPSSSSMFDTSSLSLTRSRSMDDTEGTGGVGVGQFSLTGGNWHGTAGDPSLAAFEREHEEATKVKNIEKIIMGPWEVEAWYYSPFPDNYSDLETLYVCEFCLTYMKKVKTYKKHKAECQCRQPPGKEIYREDDLSVYEIDGKEHRLYCQKLCLLAKLFLDHKTLYFETSPFLFYIVCKTDNNGAHIVGYFSKEKNSSEGYNLACILTFPQFQQCGYGKFIISLSYELTKREDKTGSPEKPLSDLGKVSYRSYWTYVLMNLLANHDASKDTSINQISKETGIKTEDLISTLQSLDMIKVWKGQHVIYVKQSVIRDYMKQKKTLRLCNPEYLNWEPKSTGMTERDSTSA